MKFNEYITEEDNKEEEDSNSQKIKHLATILDQKENFAKMKRGVSKALEGKPLSDSERVLLKDILGRIFRPKTATFLRLIKKF